MIRSSLFGIFGCSLLASCGRITLLPASTIQPYVDLLTWQVIAVVAGFLFAPAVYVLVLRIKKFRMGENEFDLSSQKIEQMQKRATQDAEHKDAESAADEVETIADADAGNIQQRLEKVLKAWGNIQLIIRDAAAPIGGARGLNSAMPNLRLLQSKGLVTPADVETAQDLRDRRSEYTADPSQLSAREFRSYAVKAGKFAERLRQIKQPPP